MFHGSCYQSSVVFPTENVNANVTTKNVSIEYVDIVINKTFIDKIISFHSTRVNKAVVDL